MKKKNGFLFIVVLSVLGIHSLAFSCGSVIPTVTYTVPGEVAQKEAYFTWNPPADFTAVNFWMQAIHDMNSLPWKSEVTVDWMRLYCRDSDGVDTLVGSKEFDLVESPFPGGLYIRQPWFMNDSSQPMPVQYNLVDGYVSFTPGDRYEKVWHWWGKRALMPDNTDYCYMDARVYVQGPAMVQAGIDIWIDLTAPWNGTNVNNVEAGVSDWFFESSGWQTISVRPLN